jgi:hypothetical protein
MSTIGHKKSDHAGCSSTEESVSQIAASIASRLAKSREGRTTFSDDPQQASTSVPIKGNTTLVSGCQNGTASTQLTPQILHDQADGTTVTPDEYLKRLDSCLTWAREANAGDVRLACLTLAQAWLSAAMRGGDRALESKNDKS